MPLVILPSLYLYNLPFKRSWFVQESTTGRVARYPISGTGKSGFNQSFLVDRLWPTVYDPMQQDRIPCPLPSPGISSNSCPCSRWCHPTISLSFALFSSCPHPSQHQGLFSTLRMRWPKYWSFSFSISPSNEYSWFISFSIDWFDLLAVQGSLKSLIQHHSSKASILWHPAFFTIQLTSVPDYWKHHSFDWMDLCQKNVVSTF